MGIETIGAPRRRRPSRSRPSRLSPRGGRPRAALAGALALGLVVTLAACAPTYPVKTTETSLVLPCNGSTTVNAQWAFPEGVTPTGMIYLQHGFARSNDAVVDLLQRYAARGWVAVAPTVSAFGSCSINSAALHAAVTSVLAGGTAAGSPLQTSMSAARSRLGLPALAVPSKLVLSGHSAGGALVTVVGGQLATSSTAVAARLRGVVLLDPVENGDGGMAANLPKLAGKPVLTISAPDSSCNSNSSGTKVLLGQRSGFAGVRLTTGCHCDAEADSTDALCTITCGTPSKTNKDALRRLAADWASDMLNGTVTADSRPGGTYYETQRANGVLSTLTGTRP